jgi:hypothetical protein
VKVGDGSAVTLDGIDLGFGSADVVDCSANLNSVLTVVRSALHDAGRTGLMASNCTVTLDADTFTNDALGGISVANGKYEITNCTITQCGKSGAAVTLTQTLGGHFRHNTVTANNPMTGVGGVACVPGGQTVEASIVWGNAKFMNSQVLGCVVSNSLLDEMIGTGNKTGPAPTFTPDFHLDGHKNGNDQCCIDQIDSSSVMHDRDYNPRPFNVKYDIGAHEVQN